MPIQEKAIPTLLSGQTDFVGLAQTGTGKTGAFGLPLLQLVDAANPQPQGIVLCPTRELCMQITDDLTRFAAHLKGIRVVAVYGGAALSDFRRTASFKKRLVPVCLGAAYLPFAFIVYFQLGFGLLHPGLYGSPVKLSLVPCGEALSNDLSDSCYPTGFVEYARESGLSGRIAADYPWGAFLGFMLGRGISTGLDGRCETVFPQDVRDSAFRFSEGGEGWRDFLRDYPPDMVLARKGSPVHFNMEREPGWKTGWQDGGTVLFVPAR